MNKFVDAYFEDILDQVRHTLFITELARLPEDLKRLVASSIILARNRLNCRIAFKWWKYCSFQGRLQNLLPPPHRRTLSNYAKPELCSWDRGYDPEAAFLEAMQQGCWNNVEPLERRGLYLRARIASVRKRRGDPTWQDFDHSCCKNT